MPLSVFRITASLSLLAAAFVSPATTRAERPIKITADLTEAPRRLFHAEIDIPVEHFAKDGVVTLTTPVWIPGTHAPGGPLTDITGVVFTANGTTLKWRRDDVTLSEFHVTVPKGVNSIHAHLDCIVTTRVTTKMAVLEWEKLMLYPAHISTRELSIEPSVTVPAGWGVGTALTPVGPDTAAPNTGVMQSDHQTAPGATTTRYAVTNVEQLEDTPLISGLYFHEFPLAPEITPKHFLDVVADEPEDAQMRPETLAEVSNLVREAYADYKSHHYNEYHFLLTLSDVAGGQGLEHGQSSDNGVGEKGFSDDAHQLGESDLLAHEFTHSWNGKYRRPARLYQPDFATPQQGDLMWVYEGMTQYLGNVLAARSGLKSQEQYRDLLALSAAQLAAKSGRNWRSTEDTAIAGSLIRGGNASWVNWRRGQDYYQEGELLWLDTDTLIRKLTNDKKSLNDFEAIFLAKGGSTGPLIAPYEFPELVADLSQVVPYDWAAFLHDRISNINPKADLDGIERGGYKLTYSDKPSKSQTTLASAGSRRAAGVNLWYSLGLSLTTEGKINDVRWDGPSDAAKLVPGETIYAVDGKLFSADVIKRAITAAKGATDPIHLIVEQDGNVSAIEINYHNGERYPVLTRIDGATDYLDEITKPLTTPVAAK